MKISLITVVLNAQSTIQDALDSVAAQSYQNIEHIVIDGGSTDGTLDILEASRSRLDILISEPDNGLYDAMNKGIRLASGDVIGILNADDFYQHDGVLQRVAETHAARNLDACYADLVYVKPTDLTKVVRYWRSGDYFPGRCFRGWMPAHPTLFLKRGVYESVGLFDTSLRYQADLEFCARLFEVHRISSVYIPELWVKMRLGGVTNNSFKSMAAGNWESYLALRKLGLRRNPISYFAIKFASRLKQYFQR